MYTPPLKPVNHPTGRVLHKEDDIELFMNGTESSGLGTLVISEDSVAWLGNAAVGLTLSYPSISVHAVSSDPETFHKPCLYILCEAKDLRQLADGDNDNVTNEDEDEEDAIAEFRFAPKCAESLQDMFMALSDGQSLHPDPEDSDSEDEDFMNPLEDHVEDETVDADHGGQGDGPWQGEDNGDEDFVEDGEGAMDHQYDDAEDR